MKELSIEEKAKRYDELKVTAQELEHDGCFDKITLFDLFPELKERSTERRRCMTDKEKIRNIIELFIAWNGETEVIDVANLDSAVYFIADSLQEESVSIWHNMDEVPIKGEVIVVQTKDTFYGLSIQKGGTTYKNRNKDKYVRWAYASDLLNISDVQRTIRKPHEGKKGNKNNRYCKKGK